MKCKKTAVFLAMILLAAFHAVAQSPEQMAIQAAKAYNNMQFQESIKVYTKIIDQGYESYALYYRQIGYTIFITSYYGFIVNCTLYISFKYTYQESVFLGRFFAITPFRYRFNCGLTKKPYIKGATRGNCIYADSEY